MADSGFSEDGKYYASISEDGRLKIWDTETNALKQQFTPDLHLSAPPSCLQWIQLAHTFSSVKKGKKRKSQDPDEVQRNANLDHIALGTKNGRILIYSVAQATVETVLGDTKNQDLSKDGINCLDWHANYGLFTCSNNNQVIEWNLSDGSVRNKYDVNFDTRNKHANKISAIKLLPQNRNASKYLITASHQIRLWNLDSSCVIKSMVGHSSGVELLKIAQLPNKCLVMSASKKERLLSFWDVTLSDDDIGQNGKKIKNAEALKIVNPSYNFVLEDAPRHVDLLLKDNEKGCNVNISAVTRSGVLHYYGHVLNGTSTKPIKPCVTVHVSTAEATPMPLQCCKFSENAGESEIIVGYLATPTRCHFERVVPDLKTRTQVLIRESPSIEKSKKKSKEAEKDSKDKEETSKTTYVEPMGGVVSRKRNMAGGDVEVPMESRLANLTIERSKTPVNQNLTKLLIQGLHSKDKDLTLAVLQKDDWLVAYRTCSHLPSNYIPMLIEQLTDMASRRISQCKSVCVWLNALLRCHSAILLATINTKSTSEKLSQLITVLTQRRSHLNQLLNLKGKLEMTVKQKSGDNEFNDDKAIIEFNDDSSSEDEMEVDLTQNGDSSDALSWDADSADGSDSDAKTSERGRATSERSQSESDMSDGD